MAKKDTASFLAQMNERNNAIAAQEAGKIPGPRPPVGVDPVREQREAERRERLGQLRAVPHQRKKTGQVRSVFGHIDLT